MYTRVAPFCLPLELRGHLHSMYYISAACSLGFVVQVGLAAVEGAIQNSSIAHAATSAIADAVVAISDSLHVARCLLLPLAFLARVVDN